MATQTVTIASDADQDAITAAPFELLTLHQPQSKPADESIRDARAPADDPEHLWSTPAVEAGPAVDAEAEYPSGIKLYIVVVCLTLLVILASMDQTIVATAVPQITDHFHTVADVGWYSSAYRLMMCSFQFMFGKLYKLFPVKKVLLSTTALFLCSSFLCGVAVTSKMFIVGRAVAGLGGAGVLSGSFVLLVYMVPLRKRPLYTSALGMVEGATVIAAPILGGVLTDALSWRWCFYISLPLGGVTIAVMAIFLTEFGSATGSDTTWKQKIRELDLLSNVLFVPSLTSLFIALAWAGVKYPWASPQVIGLLVTFAILLTGFIYQQHRRQDSATLPPRIVKQRSIIAGAIFMIGCNSSVQVIQYYMPTYFQTVKGYSAAKSGYLMIPICIGAIVGELLCGSGTSLGGYYTPFMIAGSVLMPVAAGLMTTWTSGTTFAQMILLSGFMGLAGSIGFMGPQLAAQSTLPGSDIPMGLAIVIFTQSFGPALFSSIAQTVFVNRLATNFSPLLPGLTAQEIESLGYSELIAKAGPRNLDRALSGLDASLMQTWYLALGLGCVSVIGAGMMEWRSVKQKRT